MKPINPNALRQMFILLLIISMGGIIIFEMSPFLPGVLGAITLYVILNGYMTKLIQRGWYPKLAAVFLMALSFIGILIPLSGLIMLLGNRLKGLAMDSSSILETAVQRITAFEEWIGYEVTSYFDVSTTGSWLSQSVQIFAGNTLNAVIAIGIMYVMLYYMLINRRKFREMFVDYLPLGEKNLEVIGDDIKAMVRANALGIPFVALCQALVAFIGFLIFGIDHAILWSLVVFVGAMVPLIGAGLGIIPVFLLLLLDGQTFQAWGIAIYGLLVIGLTDNLMHLFILKKLEDVHPLITLIGVVIGLPLFGFIGLIFGPLFVSLFLIVLRIYKAEYGIGYRKLP